MVHTDNQFRAHVVKLGDGRLMCGFCHQVFAATTSLWRFKWHWSRAEGHGVRPCPRVDPDTKEAASLAHQQPPNKKRKSSSNMNDETSTSTRGQINEVGNLAGDLRSMRLEQGVPGREGASSDAQVAGDSLDKILGMRPEEIEELLNGLPVIENVTDGTMLPADTSLSSDRSMAQELERDAPQATECETIQNNPQLMEVDAENGIGGLVQPVAGGDGSSEMLPCNTGPETREFALPTRYTKLVGKAFEKNENQIWSWLMNDAVSFIAIYGMGGVGKTTLLEHIYEQLLERSSTFHHVCWITVSQDFSISKLQNSIAKHIDLDLSNDDNELHKAIKLSNQLKKKQRWVIILDDLWNYFELDRVGIPLAMKRCKLILTTRSLKVCERMACQKMMKVEPLLWEEAWTLFTQKLGQHKALSSEVEQIAKSITRECDGLPLGIITMAGTMRAVADIREWRNALEELKESKIREDDMEPDVFRILRFSYNHLNDSALQQCFLSCALFPEDKEINREELIAYLIDEGIIEGMKSRRAEFDKGHTMLNKLEKVSLLESCRDHGAVKMHDLLRDMAIQIQQRDSRVMVKAGELLTEFPDLEEKKESLVRISLMTNLIECIIESHSVRCPRLSTVLLQHNTELRSIADSFFEQLPSLNILDLSFTNIEILPDSISDLVILRALLLRKCLKLRYVPSLKKLKKLRRLDLTATVLQKMPQGIEELSHLRYFSSSGCLEKSEFPFMILPEPSHLQVLALLEGNLGHLPWVKGKEVGRLRKLEMLNCRFEHLCDMNDYVKNRDETQRLSAYNISVGFSAVSRRTRKTVELGGLSLSRDGDFQVMIPNDMKELIVRNCDVATSLSDVLSSIEHATELEVVDIWYCTSMVSLFSSSWFCSASALHAQLPSQSIFSGLKEFTCRSCPSMKKLFPLILLPNLANLEQIRVEDCEKMEEMVAARDEDEDEDEENSRSRNSISKFSLPKLRILVLSCLPQLKSICSATLRCDSLERIRIYHCPQLKRMPFSLLQPNSLKEIEIHPNDLWRLEWDHI